MTEKVLVVDLCGTIVRENTTHGFLTFPELPRLRRLCARLVLSRVVAFVTSRISPGAQRALLVNCLNGLSIVTLRDVATKYAKAALSRSARRTVLSRIHDHKARGGRVFLASASLDFIVEAFVWHLEADGFISTELCYDANGVCHGKIKRDATGCKLSRLHEVIGGKSFLFDAITDNPEDVDLKNAANEFWFVENHVL